MKHFALKLLFTVLVVYSSTSLSTVFPVESFKAQHAAKSLLTDIALLPNQRQVAVGERGHILYSDNGGAWQQANSPVNILLTKVFFINENRGWAVGHDATILVTENGGVDWSIQQFLPKVEKPLLDVWFKDELNGVAIGSYGLFYRTKDGGKNWRKEFHSELLFPEDAEYLDELKESDPEAYEEETTSILPHFNRLRVFGNDFYIAGEAGLLCHSNDFGKTWTRYDEFYLGSFFDITKTENGSLLAVGLRGSVYISTDDGQQWKQVKTDRIATINSVVKNSKNEIVLLANSGVTFVSSDNGSSFTSKSQPDGKALMNGVFSNGQLVVASEVGIKTISVK